MNTDWNLEDLHNSSFHITKLFKLIRIHYDHKIGHSKLVQKYLMEFISFGSTSGIVVNKQLI